MTTAPPVEGGLRREIFDDVHDAFRESVHGFLMKEAVPNTERWQEQGLIDREFWLKAAAQGYVAFEAPEELGGLGIDDFRFNAIINEEVAYTGTPYDGFSLTNDIALPYLLELTTEEQRRRWLPAVTSGECIPAIAMSEPGAGSDLRAIASTATWRGDHWELSGSKTFVTNGTLAGLVIVAARVRGRDTDGLALFVVTSDMEGFQRGRLLKKVGRKAQDTAELFFESVRLAPEDMIGEEGRGLNHLMRNLAQERLSIACMAAASAERVLEITLEHVKSRNAFGKPIGSFQANRFSLAELATEISIGRVYIDRCVVAHTRRELGAAEAAKAKLWTTELEFRAVDLGMQLHGGYGYMEEYEIARRWRDARVERIYGGTSEIMKEIIGRSLGL
jgi:acyl-CoA dehydrogenase